MPRRMRRDECHLCAYPGTDVACGEDVCTDGKERYGLFCDGEGVCAATTEVDCGLYVCGASECLASCASDDDCVDGASCVGSSCEFDVSDSDAGVDGGDEADAGDDDAGEDAGADAAPGDADGGSEQDPAVESSEADEPGCSCRAVGGKSKSEHAAWLGLGLAAAVMWRRGRSRLIEGRDAR